MPASERRVRGAVGDLVAVAALVHHGRKTQPGRAEQADEDQGVGEGNDHPGWGAAGRAAFVGQARDPPKSMASPYTRAGTADSMQPILPETAMPAASRLLVAFVVLITVFVVLVGFAAVSLAAAGQPAMAGVVATAGLVGVAAGGVTCWLLRRENEDDEIELDLEPITRSGAFVPRSAVTHAPVRVQSMPVAKLPPAYLDAVMKGAQARLSALKAQSRGL